MYLPVGKPSLLGFFFVCVVFGKDCTGTSDTAQRTCFLILRRFLVSFIRMGVCQFARSWDVDMKVIDEFQDCKAKGPCNSLHTCAKIRKASVG